MGYNIVIYPVTTLRLALKAVERGLSLLSQDKQKDMLSKMQSRKRLYELLKYEDYKKFDKEVFNFSKEKLKKGNTMSYKITVAYGDGIGPEIMTVVLSILQKAGADSQGGCR